MVIYHPCQLSGKFSIFDVLEEFFNISFNAYSKLLMKIFFCTVLQRYIFFATFYVPFTKGYSTFCNRIC